jgi:serine/threonine protein kinase
MLSMSSEERRGIGASSPSEAFEETTAVPSAGGQPATRLLHYRLLEKLGEGGMGTVHKAEDDRLGRVVAIKRLVREPSDDLARQRLVREARAASALNHPNIVTIYAIEETGQDTFIVMEYLEGKTLSAAIAEGPLEPARVVTLGA